MVEGGLPIFKNILVPTDGSTQNQHTFRVAVSIAEKYEATLHVLCVADLPEGMRTGKSGTDVLSNDMLVHAKKVVGVTVDAMRKTENLAIEEHVRKGHPAEEIIAAGHQWHIDLIVMGTHGHRGKARVQLGTITEEVVRNSPIPVLTVQIGQETHE